MQAEISHFVLIAAALCAVFLSLPTLLGSKRRAPLFVHLWKHKDQLDKNKEVIIFKTAKQEVANFYRRNKLSFSDFKEETHLSIVKDEYDEDEFRSYSEQAQKLLKLIPEKSKSFF